MERAALITVGAAGLGNQLPLPKNAACAGVALSKIIFANFTWECRFTGLVKPPTGETVRVRVGEEWTEEAE